MADTIAFYTPTTGGPIISSIDPFDFVAIFAPHLYLPDIVPPVVDSISPPEGTELEPGELVHFNVTDETGLALSAVYALFQSADPTEPSTYEVVWDGLAFAPWYVDFSSRTPITIGLQVGYRYSIARKGGWPAAPSIHVVAVDRGGNIP